MSKTKIIPVSLPSEMARQLDRQAKKESMTRSEYVRSILRRQLAIKKLDELQKVTARQAKKTGIKTLSDAVKAVREVRN